MAFTWNDEPNQTRLDPHGVILSCFPSAGLAGIVAGHYMVRTLNLARVGLFEAPDPAPLAVIQSGRVHPPVRAYGRSDLAVVMSEFPQGPGTAGAIARTIMEGAEKRQARIIICFEGVVPHPIGLEEEGAPPKDDEEKVWVVTSRSDPTLDRALTLAYAHTLEDGVIGGVTGALLVAGLTHPIPVAALLVSARPTEGYPDDRAAAVLIETLDRLFPELTIDTAPLRTQAQMIEKALRQAMKSQERPSERPPPPAEPNIYQ
ncbi:MAG: proteasome assembly chaperone family protein [Thermoplasmata archaeon]